MPWYVVYTNPRAEKKVAQQLATIGVEVFCPVIKQVRQWSDRKKIVEAPLFSSYIFVNVDEDNRNIVFSVKGAVRFLFWLGKPAVVKQEEIQEIKNWLDTQLTSNEFTILREGSEIEITDGHFKGKSGIIQQVTKNYVRVVLESIGFVVVIKILNKEE